MTHYQALELPETATAADIRRAYRRLVLLTHPDRTPDPAAHARYLAVNAAYEVLSDPARRHAYDKPLHVPASSPVYNSSPGKAKDAYHRSASNPHRRSKPTADSYNTTYLRYAPIGRLACKALLVFSLLLAIDRLWVLDFPNETVLSSDFYSSKQRGRYCVVETLHASFSGQCFYVGEVITLRRTALFRQVLSHHSLVKNEEAVPDDDEGSNFIYDSGGALFPIVMFITAAVGAWPGRTGRRQVDCAMTASILAIITIWLMVSF